MVWVWLGQHAFSKYIRNESHIDTNISMHFTYVGICCKVDEAGHQLQSYTKSDGCTMDARVP